MLFVFQIIDRDIIGDHVINKRGQGLAGFVDGYAVLANQLLKIVRHSVILSRSDIEFAGIGRFDDCSRTYYGVYYHRCFDRIYIVLFLFGMFC